MLDIVKYKEQIEKLEKETLEFKEISKKYYIY